MVIQQYIDSNMDFQAYVLLYFQISIKSAFQWYIIWPYLIKLFFTLKERKSTKALLPKWPKFLAKSHQIWYIFIIKCQKNFPKIWVNSFSNIYVGFQGDWNILVWERWFQICFFSFKSPFSLPFLYFWAW